MSMDKITSFDLSGLRNMAYSQVEQNIRGCVHRGAFFFVRAELSDMMFDQVWTEVKGQINSEMYVQRNHAEWERSW